ncbi:MAG: hypothetical protein D6722_28215, partial [Bacteroidetes bacterium]
MSLPGRTGCLTLLLFFATGLLPAQTAQTPWAIGLGGGMVQYLTHPSLPTLPSEGYFPGADISLNKYLNGAFDFRTSLAFGPEVRFPGYGDAIVSGYYLDMSYQLRFKVNNGLFLRESSFLGPYAVIGIGGSYVPGHPDAYVPLAGGIRFRLSPRASLQVETVRKLSLNKDQQQLAHAIAFIYNLPSSPAGTPPEEPEPASPLLATLLPSDTDQDGLVDGLDVCPDEAGPLSLDGCPEKETVTSLAVLDTAKTTGDPEIPLVVDEPEAITPLTDSLELVAEPLIAEEGAPGPLVPASGPERETEVPVEESPPTDNDWAVAEPEPQLPEKSEIEWALSDPESQPLEQGNLPSSVPAPAPLVEPEPEPILPVEVVVGTDRVSVTEEPVFEPQPDPMPCASAAEVVTDPVFFAYASDQLDATAKSRLDELAKVMKSCREAQLVLEGHTDDIGAENDNLVLSIMRAYHVKYYLV